MLIKEKKNRIMRDIKILFKEGHNKHYKPKRIGNFWNNNYIEYESNGDWNKNVSRGEYLNRVKPYLRDIIIDLQVPDTRKIQLTITSNLISSKDAQEERVLHSKSENVKFTSYNDANEVVGELFESLRSRYQSNLETSMQGSEFTFDSVLLYALKIKFIICVM